MTETVVRFPHAKRDCYACFDFERSGSSRCVVCRRPHGKRLPPEERPPHPVDIWLAAIAELPSAVIERPHDRDD